MSHTLRLLLLPQPLPPRLTPRTPELGLRSRGQEQEMATPRVFPLSLRGSAWVPWSRDSLTRKQNGLSLPDPPRRKNQDYKPRTLLHREGPTGSSGHPHPSLILFFWWWGEVLWAVPRSTQGLSSLTGDRPGPLHWVCGVLTTLPTRRSPALQHSFSEGPWGARC